jgi:GntR family transcriptional regulator, vanillate catabolism transcriptional regulator
MSVNIGPVNPVHRTRLVDEVTAQLREWILTGEIAAGTQLLQVELSERFGVSRTPLREAFRVLERDGLIRMANGNKTLEVVSPTTEEILDKYELRECIDGFAASRLAWKGIPEDVYQALLRDIEGMEGAIATIGLSDFGLCHTHFHSAIIEACGNRSVQDLIPLVRMSSQMMVARRLIDSVSVSELPESARAMLTEALEEGNRDHRAILEAIKAKDPTAAEAAARRHIRKGMRTIRRLSDQAVAADATSAPESVA